MNSNYYAEKGIVFLDILGFREKIESSVINRVEHPSVVASIDNMLTKLQGAGRSSEDYNGDILEPPQALHFSDTLILTFNPRQFGQLHYIVQNLFDTVWGLVFDDGTLCRGIITHGRVHHKQGRIYGPAVIEAYDRERHSVVNPRIVIDPIVLEIASQFPYPGKDPMEEQVYLESFFAEDTDGLKYLDYIGSEPLRHALQRAFSADYKKNLLYKINELSRHEKQSVKDKGEWLRRKCDQSWLSQNATELDAD